MANLILGFVIDRLHYAVPVDESFTDWPGARVQGSVRLFVWVAWFACGVSESRNILSLLAAGAVWLNLGPPRQPEGRRRDCVYHHGTETWLTQGNFEKIELEEKHFGHEKMTETFTQALAMRDCKYQPLDGKLQYRMARISWFGAGRASSGPIKGQGYMWNCRVSQRSSIDLIGLCHG